MLTFDVSPNNNLDQVNKVNNPFPNQDNKINQQWFSNVQPNIIDNQKGFNQFPSNTFPCDQVMNPWNNEERPQIPSWWSNMNYGQYSQNFMRPQYDPYQNRFMYPHSNNSVPQSPTTSTNLDIFKQNPPNEMRNPVWSSATKNISNENVIGYNLNNMTVRQAMLNETKTMQSAPPHLFHNDANKVYS